MTFEEIMQLINQAESPALEFKRELHRIFDTDGNIRSRQRDELIRDILALANGNTTTAGENAYLIFGVDDEFDPESGRNVVGVMGKLPSRREILSIIRRASEPPVEDIVCEQVEVEAKIIFVITIRVYQDLLIGRPRIEANTKVV